MKILLVNKFFHPAGGAERYARLWTRVLEERGHTVIPFAMKHPLNTTTPYSKYFVERRRFFDSDADNENRAGRLNKIRAAFGAIYSVEAARKIDALIHDERPDAAHVNSYCYQLTGSILPLLKNSGIPVIQTAHEYKHICANQRLYDMNAGEICEACDNGRWYAPLLRRCLRGSFAASATACVESALDRLMNLSRKNIDCVISPSDFMRRKMLQFGFVNPPIEHVTNLIFAEDFRADLTAEPYFLYAGRLVAHKGVQTLIEAVGRIPGARLLIAGDGPLGDEVERAAQLSPAEVKTLGFQNETELRDLMEKCRAAVVPSEWYENCPYAVLEPMAAGRAVVASRIGGIPELVDDGVTGLLFQPGNVDDLVAKLTRLWQDRKFARELGRSGIRKVQRLHDPEMHYNKLMDIFERYR